jgi:hypothetical protein
MVDVFVVIVAVAILVVAQGWYLTRDELLFGVQPPSRVGLATVLGTLVAMDDAWATIEASDGTSKRVAAPTLRDPAHSVFAPHPGILPETGDLVLSAEIEGERYYIIAGSTPDCPHAVEFDYAFDEADSIVGAAGRGLGREREPFGFRLPKASGFRATDPPDYAGRWYDYYVAFCINEDGQVVDVRLFSKFERTPVARSPAWCYSQPTGL